MKISIEWLKDYVELQESPEKLKEDLSMIGLLVEAISESDGSPVLEVEVTSNRPDCLSYAGIAREVSALYQRPLKHLPVDGNADCFSGYHPLQHRNTGCRTVSPICGDRDGRYSYRALAPMDAEAP